MPPGDYIIRLDTNPSHYVSETNFLDNDIICNLQLGEYDASVKNCHIPDDYAPEFLEKAFEEDVYEDWGGAATSGPPEMNG